MLISGRRAIIFPTIQPHTLRPNPGFSSYLCPIDILTLVVMKNFMYLLICNTWSARPIYRSYGFKGLRNTLKSVASNHIFSQLSFFSCRPKLHFYSVFLYQHLHKSINCNSCETCTKQNMTDRRKCSNPVCQKISKV